MKVCCDHGKPISEMSTIDKLACCHDHCVGPVDYNPEDMPIIEGLDLSKCREFHIEDYLLSSQGTFNTNDCISYEDMRHLFLSLIHI